MVEMIRLPVLIDMATFAGLVGIVFFIDKTVVHVRMTIHAAFAYFSELPLSRIRFMTIDAGGGQVCAGQREFGLVVFGNRV